MKTIDRISIPVSSVGYFLVYVIYCIAIFKPFNLDLFYEQSTLPSDSPYAHINSLGLGLMLILTIVSTGICVIRFNPSLGEYLFNLVKNICSLVISFAGVVVILCIVAIFVGSFENGIDGLLSTIQFFFNWITILMILISGMVSIVGFVITIICKIVENIKYQIKIRR